MTLRFEVNQAEAFRQGVNVPKSTVHLEVDPANLPQEERDLVADRLHGIDVCPLVESPEGAAELFTKTDGGLWRIEAKLPNYESLMEAIRANQAMVVERCERARVKRIAEEREQGERSAVADRYFGKQ